MNACVAYPMTFLATKCSIFCCLRFTVPREVVLGIAESFGVSVQEGEKVRLMCVRCADCN